MKSKQRRDIGVLVLLIFSYFLLSVSPALEMACAATKKDIDFIELCGRGSLRQINDAIKKGANVNASDKDKTTPLMIAASQNTNPEVVKALIEKGANVNAADKNGDTPLMYVVTGNSTERVLYELLEKGADVNAVDKYGFTALMLAAAANSNPEIPLILMRYGADMKAKDSQGRTAYNYMDNNAKLKGTLPHQILADVMDVKPSTPAASGRRTPPTIKQTLSDAEVRKLASDGFAAHNAKDYAKAFGLLSKAAGQGDAGAQNNLGWMYENGQGTKQDNDLALFWYYQSYEQGNEVARTNLNNLAPKMGYMSPDQMNAAVGLMFGMFFGGGSETPPEDAVICSSCQGQGQIYNPVLGDTTNSAYVRCSVCDGKGWLPGW